MHPNRAAAQKAYEAALAVSRQAESSTEEFFMACQPPLQAARIALARMELAYPTAREAYAAERSTALRNRGLDTGTRFG